MHGFNYFFQRILPHPAQPYSMWITSTIKIIMALTKVFRSVLLKNNSNDIGILLKIKHIPLITQAAVSTKYKFK